MIELWIYVNDFVKLKTRQYVDENIISRRNSYRINDDIMFC